jgi:hypothetical protein
MMFPIGSEKNTTIVLPLPIELFGPFLDKSAAKPEGVLPETSAKDQAAA